MRIHRRHDGGLVKLLLLVLLHTSIQGIGGLLLIRKSPLSATPPASCRVSSSSSTSPFRKTIAYRNSSILLSSYRHRHRAIVHNRGGTRIVSLVVVRQSNDDVGINDSGKKILESRSDIDGGDKEETTLVGSKTPTITTTSTSAESTGTNTNPSIRQQQQQQPSSLSPFLQEQNRPRKVEEKDDTNALLSFQEKVDAFLDRPFFNPDEYIFDNNNNNNDKMKNNNDNDSILTKFAKLVKSDYELAETIYVGLIFVLLIILSQELLRMQLYGESYIPFAGTATSPSSGRLF
jgi:hypothetical protein